MSEVKPRSRHWSPSDPSSIVIPGVDASASINDQIDQIDQLITIRLQNIDANFSRLQHLITTKLLPAFKRYAEGTEPVREAAKFWKSFYEAAAQVRIPIASDTSSVYQTEEDSEDQDITMQSEEGSDRTPTNAVSTQEEHFARGAAVSSTPLVRNSANISQPQDSEDSWAASIESPFERLGRQVRDLALEETKQDQDYPSTSSAPSFSPLFGNYLTGPPSMGQAPLSSALRSRRKDRSPLRQNVLRQNAALAVASEASSTPGPSRIKTPRNPFLPPQSSSHRWNGLVDLREPSPARSRATRTPQYSGSKGNRGRDGYDSDSSDDLFPPGMSPPITMQFAMPSRAHASPTKLALTPARKAAERIGRDLIAGAANRTRSPVKSVRGESSISSVAPSLPSLTRYSGRPTRSSVYPPPSPSDVVTPTYQPYRSRTGPDERPYAALNPRLVSVDEGVPPSPETDSDSEHDESNPSAGFLFATQNNARSQADDSFGSSQPSSDEDEDDVARAARHPLAHIFVGGAEDTFQDDSLIQGEGDDETVFGARQVGQGGERRLTLRQDALLDDTYTGAVSLNPFAQVDQSPTPYVGQVEDLH